MQIRYSQTLPPQFPIADALHAAYQCVSTEDPAQISARRLPSLQSSAIKAWLLARIRSAHLKLATRPLPERVALGFHELEAGQHAEFRRAIGYFLQRGYRSVTTTEYLAPAVAGDKRLWISFDDNHRCWHAALPLFAELGVKATFFVNSGAFRDVASESEIEAYFDRIDYRRAGRATLTTRELIELHRAGHEIGCHSHSHFALPTLPPAEWPRELLHSNTVLEQLIGSQVTSFSWPYGASRFFSPKLRAYCSEIGFTAIAGGTPGLLFQRTIDPFNLQRTRWQFTNTFDRNIEDIHIDGRLFTRLTGRSAVG